MDDGHCLFFPLLLVCLTEVLFNSADVGLYGEPCVQQIDLQPNWLTLLEMTFGSGLQVDWRVIGLADVMSNGGSAVQKYQSQNRGPLQLAQEIVSFLGASWMLAFQQK